MHGYVTWDKVIVCLRPIIGQRLLLRLVGLGVSAVTGRLFQTYWAGEALH